MKKSQVEETSAKNLEEKFEHGEDVLDYFEVRKARVMRPTLTRPARNTKASPSYSAKRESRNVIVREEPPPIAAKAKRRK